MFTQISGDIPWRYYVGFFTLPKWLLLFASLYLPESARWYSVNGKQDLTDVELRNIFRENKMDYPSGDLTGMEEDSDDENFCNLCLPDYRLTTFIMFTTTFSAAFCYYGIFFVSRILLQAHDIYFSMLLISLSEIPGILLGFYFLDQTGRKGLLGICWFLFSVVCIILVKIPEIGDDGSWWMTTVVLLLCAQCSMNMALVIVFIYIEEYYPTVIRSTADGYASSLSELASVATTVVSNNFTNKTSILLYTICSLFAFILTLMLPQDTTGMAMKEG